MSNRSIPQQPLKLLLNLSDPKFIFLDEADMFRKGEQEEVRHIYQRGTLAKVNPYIVMLGLPRSTRRIILLQDDNQKIPAYTRD